MDSKKQWRQTILEKRQQLDPRFVREASEKIESAFLSLEEFNLAERVGLYSAFCNEVETVGIFAKAHAFRKEVYYPAVDKNTQEICFYRVKSPKDLEAGFGGILEPKKKTHPLKNVNFLNLIVIPGIAFDKMGNRIGFGHGFYDKLLAPFRGKRVALAYEFQICDSLPAQTRDQRMDIIVTEERVLRIV